MSNKNKLQDNQDNQDNNGQSTLVHQSVSFSGPLPHPDVLKKFEEVHPGTAKIIIEMAKNQSEHRQSLEKNVISSDIKNSRLGLWFGFLIGMTGIMVGGGLVAVGQVVLVQL